MYWHTWGCSSQDRCNRSGGMTKTQRRRSVWHAAWGKRRPACRRWRRRGLARWMPGLAVTTGTSDWELRSRDWWRELGRTIRLSFFPPSFQGFLLSFTSRERTEPRVTVEVSFTSGILSYSLFSFAPFHLHVYMLFLSFTFASEILSYSLFSFAPFHLPLRSALYRNRRSGRMTRKIVARKRSLTFILFSCRRYEIHLAGAVKQRPRRRAGDSSRHGRRHSPTSCARAAVPKWPDA
jgi:hypothetical protein